jgi:hypothetical protein
MKTTLTIAALLLSSFSIACRSSSSSANIERMYTDLREEIGDMRLSTHDTDFWIHQQQRLKETRRLVSENRITTAVDHLYAAVILVETDSEADLDSAHTQALLAAEQGETRGFRVAAEATDKLCVKRGLVQRFGTQYVYEPVLKAWRLYPFDPNTTDAERKAMGVESMAELREREKLLNEITGGKPN